MATPFTVDPELTAVVVAYENAELIADRVLPRVKPVLTKQTFTYRKYDFSELVTVPDTKVGRKGQPGEVEFTGTEVPAATTDYGLDDVVPADDVTQAPPGYDPLAFAAQGVMDLVLLDREVRVSSKVFSAANYAAANKATLSGTSQWSDGSSDPTAAILTAKDGLLMMPNKMVMGRAVWSVVRRHPKILQAISISGTDKGVATLQAVADLWELDEIIVGSAWVNTARKGQSPAISRAWGKHAALFRQDGLATSLNDRPTFGATFQYGTRVAGKIPEPKVGLRGATRVRAGESLAEVIMAPDLGYLFQSAVS